MYNESESENESEKFACYSIGTLGLTGSNFGDDESDRNLEYVTSSIMFIFERFSKNKLIDSFKEDVMFVLDKVNNLQEHNQAL
jgi:ribosomal protein S15P/S13E